MSDRSKAAKKGWRTRRRNARILRGMRRYNGYDTLNQNVSDILAAARFDMKILQASLTPKQGQ